MMYIKLGEDMSLTITVAEPLFRGDNLNRKIRYLIPTKIGEIDTRAACLYLSYIRADGVADMVRLERLEASYNDSYDQYSFPVTCRLTKFPGEVCTWMQIVTGAADKPAIQKSVECILRIEDSKNMDDYICDHQLSAIYALQKQTEKAESNVEDIRAEVEKKGDSLLYDTEKKTLQMSSNGKPIGDAIDMEKVAAGDDDVIHFTDDESGDTGNPDDVINF